ncbi:MAG: glycosyltransferase, partial [Bacteroidales bacterium]|nr:glycosyltransferase [Bacteroidales bacterium]
YNVEPYVERCLRSLENQDIPMNDYEIICINDGSPDNSKEVVRRLQEEFRNVILLDQHNMGVSEARNNGIDKAKGDYLLFIDPDDYVYPECFNQVITTATSLKAQVSFLGYSVFGESGELQKRILNNEYSGETYTGIDAYYLSRGDGMADPDRMWAVLFEKNFLCKHDLRYLQNVPYLEDGELIARILCLAERCIFDGSSFYKRTIRSGSATNSGLFKTEKALNGFLLAAVNLKKFQLNAKLNDRQRSFMNQPIAKFVLLTLNAALNTPKFSKYRQTLKGLADRELGRLKLKGVVRPYIYYAFAFNHVPFLFYLKAIVKQIKETLKLALGFLAARNISFRNRVK